jgi:hypothetical protein
LQWSVAQLWFAVAVGAAVLEGFLILDANPSSPEFDPLYTADRVARIPLFAVALAWLVTFVPILSLATRQRGLRRCRFLLVATSVFWITWVLSHPRR